MPSNVPVIRIVYHVQLMHFERADSICPANAIPINLSFELILWAECVLEASWHLFLFKYGEKKSNKIYQLELKYAILLYDIFEITFILAR